MLVVLSCNHCKVVRVLFYASLGLGVRFPAAGLLVAVAFFCFVFVIICIYMYIYVLDSIIQTHYISQQIINDLGHYKDSYK